MQRFDTRVRNAIEVGAFKLEDQPKETFTTTLELRRELVRLLGEVEGHAKRSHDMHDLVSDDSSTARTTLFTYKHHPGNRFEDDPLPLNQELDLRFVHGVRVGDRELRITSIFHTTSVTVHDATKELVGYPEFSGGRKVMDWRTGGVPMPFV